MAYLVGSGDDRIGSIRIDVQGAASIVNTRTGGTPGVGIVHQHDNLVGVERGRVAGLRETQLTGIDIVNLLSTLQKFIGIKGIRCRCLCGVSTKFGFPEHDEMV